MSATPGPWAVHPMRAVVVPADHLNRPLGAHADAAIDNATYAQEICALMWPDRNRPEAEVLASARLIAAAPDMLAALQGAMVILSSAESNASGNPEWDHVGPRVAAARAAIAKALGQ